MQTVSPLSLVACLIALSMIASGCAGSEPRAADARNDAKTGSIEGNIAHPAHAIPAMRICAIGSGASAKSVCVRTRRGQGRYRIDGVTPGDYIVIGSSDESVKRLGGHVQQVQCIRAPCPEMPVSLSVAPGAHLAGIDINGFYDQRDDFPALPADD
ncbi:MAG: hypothetical protein HOP03_05775 [Lysobacter sp.]|nr:hypothetical protein [Lysobacter sp.]